MSLFARGRSGLDSGNDLADKSVPDPPRYILPSLRTAPRTCPPRGTFPPFFTMSKLCWRTPAYTAGIAGWPVVTSSPPASLNQAEGPGTKRTRSQLGTSLDHSATQIPCFHHAADGKPSISCCGLAFRIPRPRRPSLRHGTGARRATKLSLGCRVEQELSISRPVSGSKGNVPSMALTRPPRRTHHRRHDPHHQSRVGRAKLSEFCPSRARSSTTTPKRLVRSAWMHGSFTSRRTTTRPRLRRWVAAAQALSRKCGCGRVALDGLQSTAIHRQARSSRGPSIKKVEG